MIFWLLACMADGELSPADPSPFHAEPPSISSVEWDCDPEESKWVFNMKTTHWTGGGWIWLGKSETNAEAHKIKSIEAAADGSTDKLRLSLTIEEDWRDASRGSSTRWLCSDIPTLTFLATVYDPRGEAVSDCRTWGSNPSLWERVESAHNCETVLILPESGDTGESN